MHINNITVGGNIKDMARTMERLAKNVTGCKKQGRHGAIGAKKINV